MSQSPAAHLCFMMLKKVNKMILNNAVHLGTRCRFCHDRCKLAGAIEHFLKPSLEVAGISNMTSVPFVAVKNICVMCTPLLILLLNSYKELLSVRVYVVIVPK